MYLYIWDIHLKKKKSSSKGDGPGKSLNTWKGQGPLCRAYPWYFRLARQWISSMPLPLLSRSPPHPLDPQLPNDKFINVHKNVIGEQNERNG